MSARTLAALFLALGAGAAAAQGVPDPTRPPPGWLPHDPKAPKVEAQKEGAEPVQLLLVGPTRRFAIVRGDLVGDKTAGTRLVEIKRNDLVVQTERGKETLHLFPDVQKTTPKESATGERNKK